MAIAYLILAHQNITQLAKLIDSLTLGNQNYCFIHFDLGNYSSSKIKQLRKTTSSDSWHVIRRKMHINWGGFNMIEATLALILEVLNFNKFKFERLSLHSGMDFPLKDNEEIENFFKENKEKQYIEFFKLPNSENWFGNGGLDRVNYYWFIDDLGFTESYKLVRAQIMADAHKNHPEGIKRIYGGSQWFTITSECARYIIDYLNENSGIYHYFKYSYIPDEMFFQTILLNSKFKKQIVNDNLRMIDWPTGSKHPKIFETKDLNKIEESVKLFARKFDENVDSQIIQYLSRKFSTK